MQHLENTKVVCLTYSELVPAIMTVDTYDNSKKRGKIKVHGRGGNGREILIEFESLPGKYREKVNKVYGNPYEYMAKQPILDLISTDFKAQEFYTDYKLPNKMKLPTEHIIKYTEAASWLNMIKVFTTDKRALKDTLKVPVGTFWVLVTDLIRVKNVHLPTSEKRLKERLKQYQTEGYGCFVEAWRFGNDNSKKVKDEVAEALLIQMIAHQHQHDDTVIAAKYNEWAVQNDRETITSSTVGYRRIKNAHLVTQGREGNSKNYSQYSKQILRARPSAPLLLINSDDNNLDLYFREEKVGKDKKKQVNPYYRPALYVVIDAFNDYILGYAIGDTITNELVKAAYRNAMRHVMELTGGAYCWHQIQTDRWHIGKNGEKSELADFFKSQATFTPATAKVAQSKYIERSFGPVWHQQLKMFPNYAGFNITAKQRINPDAVERSVKTFPLKENAPEVVATFIENMRQTVNPKTGLPRQTEWLNAFHASETSRVKQLGEESRLLTFGVQHAYETKLTPGGIRFTLNRQPLVYDIPEEYYLENVGKKVQVIYDPYDLSKVLVTDGKSLRFVASEFEKMPSALADFEEGHRHRLNNLLDEKKRIMQTIGSATEERYDILKRANLNAESLLQAGVKVKELRYEAEKTLTGSTFPNQEDSNYNISIAQLM